jgi:hypothetical protein
MAVETSFGPGPGGAPLGSAMVLVVSDREVDDRRKLSGQDQRRASTYDHLQTRPN